MTPRQKQTLDWIAAFKQQRGYAPSFEEIAVGIGTKSKGCVAWLVTRLEERGLIRTIANKARSIEIVEDGRE